MLLFLPHLLVVFGPATIKASLRHRLEQCKMSWVTALRGVCSAPWMIENISKPSWVLLFEATTHPAAR